MQQQPPDPRERPLNPNLSSTYSKFGNQPPVYQPQPPQPEQYQPPQWQSQQYPYPQPQPQYTPPPMVQPPPPKKKSRKKLWLIIGAIIIVLIIVANIGAHLSPSSTDTTPQATQPAQTTQATQAVQPTQPPAKPTAVPTQAVQPTATTSGNSNIQPTHGTPHLGGPLSDFVGAYGAPDAHSNFSQGYDVLHLLPSSTSNIDGIIVASYPGDTTYQAADITVQATNDIGWTSSDAQARCMTFAPSDSHLKQRFVYADNSGYDLVYTSVALASDFPASDFTDGQSNTVQAGMFDVSYLYASDGQHIGSCDMIIGEQQTTG